MTYRAANPDVVSAAAASVQPALLVWGRVQNGRLQLEPAFEVNARPVLPKRGGPYTVQGLDVNGAPLFSYSFDVDPVADLGAGDGTFAFAIPLGAVRQDLAELRVSGAGQQLRVVSQPLAIAALRRAPTLPAKIIHGGAQEVALEWDAVAFPEVMVRDPKTGEVLSIARGGRSSLFTSRSTLELVFSDGVRSVVKRAAVQ